jgi:hypothetical protein
MTSNSWIVPSKAYAIRALVVEHDSRGRWNVEQSLYGGGNWEFQYYIDSSSNVYVKNGSLYLKPGLFEQLPPIRTIPNSDVLYNASDVMYGTCEPLPECATFVVPNCTDARFKGCLKIGNATGEIINPVTSGRVNSKVIVLLGHEAGH